jgi:hypothetical protein
VRDGSVWPSQDTGLRSNLEPHTPIKAPTRYYSPVLVRGFSNSSSPQAQPALDTAANRDRIAKLQRAEWATERDCARHSVFDSGMLAAVVPRCQIAGTFNGLPTRHPDYSYHKSLYGTTTQADAIAGDWGNFNPSPQERVAVSARPTLRTAAECPSYPLAGSWIPRSPATGKKKAKKPSKRRKRVEARRLRVHSTARKTMRTISDAGPAPLIPFDLDQWSLDRFEKQLADPRKLARILNRATARPPYRVWPPRRESRYRDRFDSPLELRLYRYMKIKSGHGKSFASKKGAKWAVERPYSINGTWQNPEDGQVQNREDWIADTGENGFSKNKKRVGVRLRDLPAAKQDHMRVLLLRAAGKTDREIADELGKTPKQVRLIRQRAKSPEYWKPRKPRGGGTGTDVSYSTNKLPPLTGQI